MIDQRSLLTVLIIGVCVLIGIFIATLKKTDRLTVREISVLGFFRGIVMWSAVLLYLTSLVTFLSAFALRVGLARQEDINGVIGSLVTVQFDVPALFELAILSFGAASAAMIVMIVIAIEMHLRRIANSQDRPVFFNT